MHFFPSFRIHHQNNVCRPFSSLFCQAIVFVIFFRFILFLVLNVELEYIHLHDVTMIRKEKNPIISNLVYIRQFLFAFQLFAVASFVGYRKQTTEEIMEEEKNYADLNCSLKITGQPAIRNESILILAGEQRKKWVLFQQRHTNKRKSERLKLRAFDTHYCRYNRPFASIKL